MTLGGTYPALIRDPHENAANKGGVFISRIAWLPQVEDEPDGGVRLLRRCDVRPRVLAASFEAVGGSAWRSLSVAAAVGSPCSAALLSDAVSCNALGSTDFPPPDVSISLSA